MDSNDRVHRGQGWADSQMEDGDAQKERCPLCSRVNEPRAADVCAHWAGLVWEGELSWCREAGTIKAAWKAAEELVQLLKFRNVLEDFRAVCTEEDALDALIDGEPLWWTGEASQVRVRTENGMLSSFGDSLYHEAPQEWLTGVAERLRTVATEAEEFEAEQVPGDINQLPRRVQRDVDALAAACHAGQHNREAFARITGWIEETCADAMSDPGEGGRVALPSSALAGELDNIDDDDVREHLELDDDTEVSDEDRLTWFQDIRLPELLEDADISSGLGTIQLSATDGRSVLLVHGTRGYSFSGVTTDWYGAFADLAAFERALADDGWIEGVDAFSELDTQEKLRRLAG